MHGRIARTSAFAALLLASASAAEAASLTSSAAHDLSELLAEEVPAGVGSFGYRLRKYGIQPYIHGALSADVLNWKPGGESAKTGFELHAAQLYAGADLVDRVVPEIFVELAPHHLDQEEANVIVYLRYAQLDVKLFEDLLVLRAGLFLIPFGIYNTESYPRFISKVPEEPRLFGKVVPVPWQEVGVSVFGSVPWSPGLSIRYAFYVTNGLEYVDDPDDRAPSDAIIELDDLRASLQEQANDQKSVGARITMDLLPGVSLGVSAYTGAYTTEAEHRLSLLGTHVGFRLGRFELDLELALARQGVTGGTIDKWGYGAILSYQVAAWLVPVLETDHTNLGGDPSLDRRVYQFGLNLFPFPEDVPTAVAKLFYELKLNRADREIAHGGTAQLAVGF